MTDRFRYTRYPSQIVIFLAITCGCWVLYAGVTAVLLYLSAGRNITGLADMMYNPRYLNLIKAVQSLSSVMIFLLPAFVFALIAGTGTTRYLGLTLRRVGYMQVALVLLIMIACLPFIGLTAQWNNGVHFPAFLRGVEKWMRDTDAAAAEQTKYLLGMKGGGDLVVNLVMIALLPALGEELFFRGVLQKLVIGWTGKVNAGIVLTSILFSALHFEFLGFLPRVILGIILGYIYVISGSIWLAVLAHFFNNGLQVVMLYLFQTHLIRYDVTKDQPVPLLAGLISLAMVGALFFLFRRYGRERNSMT